MTRRPPSSDRADPMCRLADIATLCLVAALAGGCADNQQYGAAPDTCAAVVKAYLDLPNTVAILSAREEAGGHVQIRYESTDAMNLPVRGDASCALTRGTLTAATVAGTPLSDDAVAVMNRTLATQSR